MSLMSTSFVCLSVLLVIEVNASLDINDVEPWSLSCFNTEMPAVGVPTSSAVCLCSLSIFIGVHFRLAELAGADDGTVSSEGVSDFDVRTLLKGAGKDANFCARILTGKFHRVPAQCQRTPCRFVSTQHRTIPNSYFTNHFSFSRTNHN